MRVIIADDDTDSISWPGGGVFIFQSTPSKMKTLTLFAFNPANLLLSHGPSPSRHHERINRQQTSASLVIVSPGIHAFEVNIRSVDNRHFVSHP